MTVQDKLLSVFAKVRHDVIDVKLGLRRYRVMIRREAPSDGRGGIGATMVTTDTELTEKPKVRPAGEKDVITSGGRVLQGDWIMERITPPNEAATVGTALSALVPTPNPSTAGEKVFVVLVGPGMLPYVETASPGGPSGGSEFTAFPLDPSKNFQYVIGLHPRTGAR